MDLQTQVNAVVNYLSTQGYEPEPEKLVKGPEYWLNNFVFEIVFTEFKSRESCMQWVLDIRSDGLPDLASAVINAIMLRDWHTRHNDKGFWES